MMNYNFTDKCLKDLKKLRKIYRSLDEDLKRFCLFLKGVDFNKNKKFCILHTIWDVYIVKARLFCESLRKSSLRIIFSYDIKNKNITHIEIYFKWNKENEDKQRITEFIENKEKHSIKGN